MPIFRFAYETVLHHRRRIEEDRQRELAQHLRHRMILLDQLRLMQQTIRDSKLELGDALVGKVNLQRIAQFAQYSGQTAIRAQQIVQRLVGVEQEIDAARARLLEATRDRKALELLKDQRRRAWLREQNRREAAELDEIAVQRHARRLMALETADS
jgi:flagellar FliJ protein